LKDTRKVIHRLNKALHNVPIALISPKPSLARIKDGLHMTKSGYELWAGEIIKYIK
jgi:lysophospholipase L1-like esterase